MFSRFGCQFTAPSGILELMDDLGQAMTVRPETLMLGGGNPAAVPAVQAVWRQRITELLAENGGAEFDRLLVNYDPPQGNPQFLAAFADLLRRELGWPVTAENVAITNGTQTALFYLLNILGGDCDCVAPDVGMYSGKRRILLPLQPEYIGYADQGIDPQLYVACRPRMVWPRGEDGHVFRYEVDLDAVADRLAAGDIAAALVSRPANPTGGVLSDAEIQALTELTAQHGAYFIVDGAYGVPFPGIVYGEANAFYAPHVIHTFSLSKLGLPGTRTGLVVGPPEIIKAISALNAIVGLANGNLGQRLALPLVESGELLRLGELLRPYYWDLSQNCQQAIEEFVGPSGQPWAIHESQGAFFLWLWLPGLPGGSRALYERLKAREVIVVPGEYFYYGASTGDWPQRTECLRLSFSQSKDVVREGIRRLGAELAESRR